MKWSYLLLQSDFNRDEAEACSPAGARFQLSSGGAGSGSCVPQSDLATPMASRGEIDNARELLRPVFEHFVEGLDTADVKVAERSIGDASLGLSQHSYSLLASKWIAMLPARSMLVVT